MLHIDTERSWRGGERQLYLLLEGLNNRQCEVHVIGPPESEIVKRTKEIAKVRAVAMRGGVHLGAARSIARYCRDHDIDLVDCHSANAHSLALLATFFGMSARIVVHRRVDYVPKPTIANRLKYGSSKVDRYVAISHAIGRILVDFGVDRTKVSVVHSAVPQELPSTADRLQARAKVQNEFGIDTKTPIICNVGALTEQKGHDHLLKALAILSSRSINFICLIAGEGHLRPNLLKLREELGLQSSVHFLGFRSDVRQLLWASDIMCMPSNFEGLGTSILDAIYAGCCIVASDVGGIPEMIESGVSGFLSKRGDIEQLAHDLQKTIFDQPLRIRTNSNARNFVSQRFSTEAMVEGNWQVYLEVCQR